MFNIFLTYVSGSILNKASLSFEKKGRAITVLKFYLVLAMPGYVLQLVLILIRRTEKIITLT